MRDKTLGIYEGLTKTLPDLTNVSPSPEDCGTVVKSSLEGLARSSSVGFWLIVVVQVIVKVESCCRGDGGVQERALGCEQRDQATKNSTYQLGKAIHLWDCTLFSCWYNSNCHKNQWSLQPHIALSASLCNALSSTGQDQRDKIKNINRKTSDKNETLRNKNYCWPSNRESDTWADRTTSGWRLVNS